MNFVSGSTSEEKRLVKGIQNAVGAYADNSIGPVTLIDIAAKVNADCFPLAVKLYENPSIVCKDILVFNPRAGLTNYTNSISGSFSYQQKPCSILINKGTPVCSAACHAWLKKPESVLYCLKDGTFGIKRCLSASELPINIKWAIGGMGLLDLYSPATEGFSGAYADVLRLTDHTMIGVKGSLIYLSLCKNMTGAQVNAYAKKMNFEKAIMLDGGHVAAMNSAAAKYHTTQVQYYAIQAV